MRTIIGLAVALSLGMILAVGCDTSGKPPADVGGLTGGDAAGKCCDSPEAKGCCAAKKDPLALCGGCGQIKGSDVCCAEGADKCPKCELVKGSPGCCKIEKGSDAKLCTKCGQIVGSDKCCAEGAEKCPKCNLAKGSPGCCKVKT